MGGTTPKFEGHNWGSRVPHLRDGFIVVKVGIVCGSKRPYSCPTHNSLGNPHLPTYVYRSTAKKPPRRTSTTAVFDNPAGAEIHKPNLMNTLHQPTPLYKTFSTSKHQGPDLTHM